MGDRPWDDPEGLDPVRSDLTAAQARISALEDKAKIDNLIKQKLGSEVDRLLRERDEARAELQQLKTSRHEYTPPSTLDVARDENERLRTRVARLETALRFYANREHYESIEGGIRMSDNYGDRARQALEDE